MHTFSLSTSSVLDATWPNFSWTCGLRYFLWTKSQSLRDKRSRSWVFTMQQKFTPNTFSVRWRTQWTPILWSISGQPLGLHAHMMESFIGFTILYQRYMLTYMLAQAYTYTHHIWNTWPVPMRNVLPPACHCILQGSKLGTRGRACVL